MNPCTAPGSASRRMEEGFEDAEIKLLNLLAKHIPVVAVITKSRADNGFAPKCRDFWARASNVIRVRAIPELQDDGHVLGPMNLTDLVEQTMQVIPAGQRNAFAAAQRVTLRLKKDRYSLPRSNNAFGQGLLCSPVLWIRGFPISGGV
jgi:hypothetical protein